MDAPRPTKDFAKQLRRRMALPEVLLWTGLKGRRLNGLHFRRQHPIGPYVLDFYCDAARLAVEVDGAGHGFGDGPMRDAVRDDFLLKRGVRILRLSARHVLASPEGALRTIQDAAHQLLPPRGSCPEGTEGVASPAPGMSAVADSVGETPSGASRHLPLRGRIWMSESRQWELANRPTFTA